MAVVLSFNGLRATTGDLTRPLASVNTPTMLWGWGHPYARIYATQPNVRTCVDFLARNIAQIGYHLYRRVSDTDRVRLADHEVVQWLEHPNSTTTRYRLFESFVADLALYFNAWWLKVRLSEQADGVDRRLGLVRVPPPLMRIEGGLLPSRYICTLDGREVPFETTEFVYANGYNPLNALEGLSPVETLKRVLMEELAAGENRERYWRNASRVEGVIHRPKDAPKWTPAQKQQWREQWQERYVGPASTGAVPVLEDGMEFKQVSWSPKDSEYLAARKLSREECAAAWHIPLPMVGILEHATFSNIKEQHKQLYQDCLGPWLEMIGEALELFLLPEAQDTTNVYGEFNIADKMKGSFEEQAAALRALVGRPVMTANEGRARLNLPAMTNDPTADRLAAQQGGPSQTPAAPPPDGENAQISAIVHQHWTRQASRLARFPVPARPDAFDQDRCTAELADDLTPIFGRRFATQYATAVSDDTYTMLLEGRDAFAVDRSLPEWEVRHAA